MILSYAWGTKIINDNVINKNAEMHNSFAIFEVSSLFTLYITHISGGRPYSLSKHVSHSR